MMFFSNQAFSLKELTSKMGGVFLLFFADLKKESLNLKKKEGITRAPLEDLFLVWKRIVISPQHSSGSFLAFKRTSKA